MIRGGGGKMVRMAQDRGFPPVDGRAGGATALAVAAPVCGSGRGARDSASRNRQATASAVAAPMRPGIGAARPAFPGKPIRILPLLAAALVSQAASAHDPRPEILAPGWGILSYEAPAPGTYRLPPIMPAADGRVLREDATPAHLFDLMGDRLVLLSFVYTRCTDVNGCPLAKAVFHLVRARLKEHPDLAGATRLVSLSFDPDNDTPEAMRAYRPKVEDDRVEWRFLTTRDRTDLQPILDGYGQYTLREYDEHGAYTGEFAHLLRVFLIDRERRVRNIYSTGFLHPDILVNDLETLLLESPSG